MVKELHTLKYALLTKADWDAVLIQYYSNIAVILN